MPVVDYRTEQAALQESVSAADINRPGKSKVTPCIVLRSLELTFHMFSVLTTVSVLILPSYRTNMPDR